MRICQVVPYFPYQEHIDGKPIEKGYNIGGVEYHVYYLSKELSKLGHEIDIITTKSPINEQLSEVKNINVIRLPINFRVYNTPVSFSVFKAIKNRYDVIHTHTPVPLFADFAALANTKNKIPFALTFHNKITKEGTIGGLLSALYNKTMGKFLLSHSDKIIITTKSYKNSLPIIKFKNKLVVIPNGVNIEDINTISKNSENISKINELKLKYKIPSEDKIVLSVGALHPYKGHKYLIDAFSKLIKKHNRLHLLIVGQGPLKNELIEQCKARDILNKVTFTGYVSSKDLLYYYAMSDVFVFPSISEMEGFGIVQLEAMASKKPVISTEIPGVVDVDSEEKASIHVPPKDVDALANAMSKVLFDESLAKQMGENGRRLVEEKYTWERVAKMTEEVYKEVLKSN